MSTDNFPFNNESFANKQTEAYALRCVTHLTNAGTDVLASTKEQLKENRVYVEAMQSPAKYRKMLEPKLSGLGKMNIEISDDDLNYSPLGMVRLIFRSIYSRLNSVKNEIRVEGKDNISVMEKKIVIAKQRAIIKLAPIFKESIGINIHTPDMPESEDDLDLLELMGFPTALEYICEKLLKMIDQQNKYGFKVEPQINYDLICGAISGTHNIFDLNGMILEEALDINDLKIIGGYARDYSDAQGFVITKKFNKDEILSHYYPQYLEDARKKAGDNWYAVAESKRRDLENLAKDGLFDVQICYWMASDRTDYKVMKDDNGNENGIRPHAVANTADFNVKALKWYKAFYIRDAEFVFNFGVMNNQVRVKEFDKFSKPLSPVTLFRATPLRLQQTSAVISVIRKFEDMGTMAFIKLQNEIAKGRAAGYDINLSKLQEAATLLSTENNKINVNDVILVKLKTGVGLTAGSDGFKKDDSGSAFEFTEGGLSKAFAEYVNALNLAIDLSHMFSGSPKVDAGGSENPRTSNFAIKGMLDGADKAIVDLLETKDFIQRESAVKKLNMLLKLFNSSKLTNPYAKTLTKEELEYVTMFADLSQRELGIEIEKGLSEQEIADLKNYVVTLSEKYRETNGNEGISPIEMLHFDELYKENAKYAKFTLEKMMVKRKKETKMEKMQDQKMNASIQQESNDAATQNALMLEQAKRANLELEKTIVNDGKLEQLRAKYYYERGIDYEKIKQAEADQAQGQQRLAELMAGATPPAGMQGGPQPQQQQVPGQMTGADITGQVAPGPDPSPQQMVA